jgi:hypothetical protein
VASLPGDAATAEELVDGADRALYIAKSIGKNCVKAFSDERREHARLDVALPGRIRLLEEKAARFDTLNLSEGGVLFHSKEPLPRGTLVQLQIEIPPGREPVECAARVLRAEGSRRGFEIGTEIVHMPPAHQRRFRFFLKRLKEGGAVSESRSA